MIVVRCSDGLGNQLFQYSFWRALSIKHNQELVLDISFFPDVLRKFELNKFNINCQFSDHYYFEKYKKYTKWPLPGFFGHINYYMLCLKKYIKHEYILENAKYPLRHLEMFDFREDIYNWVLQGDYYEWFWQDPKYFSEYDTIIRKDLSLKDGINDIYNLKILDLISKSNSVSVHIRRTDFVGSNYDNICWLEYYKQSFDYIISKVNDPVFFIFSDDFLWSKKNIPLLLSDEYPVVYVDWNSSSSSVPDLVLMSKCKNNVIANSTFSRRGARLNNDPKKIVVSPKKFNNKVDIKWLTNTDWYKI